MSDLKVGTKRITRIKRILKSGAVAEKGKFACIDLDDGALVAGAVDANYFTIGYFEDSFTGDGVRLIKVRLFSELELHLCGNASSGPVADDDVGAICYLHSTFEVSMTSTSKSVAGRVWEVESGVGVWVQMMLSMGPQGAVGPQGPAGP